MIDTSIFLVVGIVGIALILTGFFYSIYKNALKGLVVLIVGILLIIVGLDNIVGRYTLGTPIEFSEIKNQKYLLKEVPSNWRIVKIKSAQSKENGWRVVKNFPADFKFSAKGFAKNKEKILYPKTSP